MTEAAVIDIKSISSKICSCGVKLIGKFFIKGACRQCSARMEKEEHTRLKEQVREAALREEKLRSLSSRYDMVIADMKTKYERMLELQGQLLREAIFNRDMERERHIEEIDHLEHEAYERGYIHGKNSMGGCCIRKVGDESFDNLPDGLALSNSQCAICLGNIRRGHPIKQLACKHQLHPLCLYRWTKHSNSCPCCRVAVI